MGVSNEVYNKVRNLVKKSEKILLCIHNRSSYDTHAAAISFALYLKDLNKNVSVCTNERPIPRHKRLFEEYEIDVMNTLEPLNYVISIDHTDGEIEKVSYDDKNGKFNLYITPTIGGKNFDFDDVAFSYGGSDFDLVFVFGARSLKWLGDIYNSNKMAFQKNTIVNVNNLEGSQEFGAEKVVDPEVPVSELVYKIVGNVSTSSVNRIVQLLLLGLVDKLQPMQGSQYKISTIEALTSLIKAGADLKEAFQKLYFRKDFKNFKVSRLVVNNMKYDENNEIAWSGISSLDLNSLGIKKDSLILDGRIIFNISKSFKATFVMYEVENNEVWVEFESNTDQYKAMELMADFNPSGNESRVVFVVQGKSMVEVEEEILAVLQEKFGGAGFVPVANGSKSVNGAEEIEDESEEGLTEPQEQGNNDTDQGEDSDGAVLITPPPITPSP